MAGAITILLVDSVTDNDHVFFNCDFMPPHKITRGSIRAAIYSKDEISPINERYYEREYNFTGPWQDTYGLPFKVAIDTKTREFQFKVGDYSQKYTSVQVLCNVYVVKE